VSWKQRQQCVLRLLITANVVRSPLFLVALMMEAINSSEMLVFRVMRSSETLVLRAMRSSETLVLTGATRLNIPEDGILHSHRRESSNHTSNNLVIN
jgi:hypothetical protein